MLRVLYRLVFVNLIGNLFRLLLWPLRPRPRWVRLTLEAPLPARTPRARFFQRVRVPSLADLSALFEGLADDARVEGLIFDLHELSGGWAHAQSVRDLVARLCARGKKVVVHLSSPSPREIYVATAATSIVVDESGPIMLTGLAAEARFYGRALEQAGVRAEVEFRGAYKSMGETFTRSDMSPAHREAVDAILDHLHAELVHAIATGRKVTHDRAVEILEGGPHTAAAALDLGLVDAVAYADEVPAWAGVEGKPAPARAWRRSRKWRPGWRRLFRPREIAVVPLHGMVVAGEGSGGRSFGAHAAARTLTSVRESRRVVGVVLHIDSRGGSAPASDLIWHEVTLLAKKKPVVAYMHDVAASGGYYIACAATKIVAQPTTLTGSIGVVAGKLSFAGLLEKLGVGNVVLRRGEAAAMHSPSTGYSDEERRRLRGEVDALYRQFVQKVAAGRSLPVEQAEEHARGRVWLGRDAHARGLVDELGDLDTAVKLARSLAGARGEPVDHAVVPRRTSLLARALGGAVPAALEEIAALSDERALFVAPAIEVN